MPVYCITGTNRGLGLEFVRQLAAHGSDTILALTRSLASDLSDLRAAAASSSSKVHILACDTGSRDSIADFASAAKSTLGRSTKIDVLINNAGVNRDSHANRQSSLQLDPDAWEEMMRVNVLGPQQMVQRLHEAGLLAKDARVVNLTSGLGSMAESRGEGGNTNRMCCGYSTSKASLNMLTVHQSGDLREAGLSGAVVVAMDPGWVRTRMGGPAAVLTADESVGGMLSIIAALGDKDNGTFLAYDGTGKPW